MYVYVIYIHIIHIYIYIYICTYVALCHLRVATWFSGFAIEPSL